MHEASITARKLPGAPRGEQTSLMPEFGAVPDTYWWDDDCSADELRNDLGEDKRLVSLDAFVRDGKVRFCAAWIANEGAAAAKGDWSPDVGLNALRGMHKSG